MNFMTFHVGSSSSQLTMSIRGVGGSTTNQSMFQLRRSEVFLRLPQVGGDQRTTKIDPRDLGICAITMGKSMVKSSVVPELC